MIDPRTGRRCRAVITDLDGTLLNDAREVSGRNLAALLSCHASGMRLIIATARPPRSVRALLPAALLERCALVCYNGAYARCGETGVSVDAAIDEATTAALIDYIMAADPEAELSMESEDEWIAIRPYDLDDALNFLERPAVVTGEQFRSRKASKLLLTRFEQLEGLTNVYGSRVQIVVTDHGRLVQIMAHGTAKELAASRLCRQYGIDPKEAIAFGDDYNDLGMFGAFGHAVAMANAVPELIAAADEVTLSNERDGVAAVLERLVVE